MLSTSEALPLLLAELGDPPLVAVDPPTSLSRLRAAVDEAGVGGLVALLADDRGEAEGLARILQRLPVEVDAIPVTEGVLVVARVQAPIPVAATRPPAWSTPDARPVPNATAVDLDDEALRRILQRSPAQDRREVLGRGTNEERYLASYGLLAMDGGTWRPTVAALVLAGHRPDLFLPACALRVEADGDALALPGPLPAMLRGMDALPAVRADRHVVLEAVANAFLHRDWRAPGPVELHASDERLEVRNPGAVLTRSPNPQLARLAAAMDLARAEGRGLSDIAARLRRARRAPYTLVQQGGVVRFLVDRPPLLRSRSRPPPTPPSMPLAATPVAPVPALLPRDLDDRADAVLRVLRERGRATTREIAAALGCSRPVIGKVLTPLVAEGRVRPEATSSRSPFQVYVAADEAA